MPNILYIKGSPDESAEMWRDAFAWRVPIDDLSHASFNVSLVHVTGEAAERLPGTAPATAGYSGEPSFCQGNGRRGSRRQASIHEIEDRPDIVNIQDHVAQEGQGAIPDRNARALGTVGCRDHPHEKDLGARVARAFRRAAAENMELAGHSLC